MKDLTPKEKRHRTMLLKHGSEDGIKDYFRELQKKSRENYKGTGGFKYMKEHDPKRLQRIAKEGNINAHAKRSQTQKTS